MGVSWHREPDKDPTIVTRWRHENDLDQMASIFKRNLSTRCIAQQRDDVDAPHTEPMAASTTAPGGM
jgi:hypothetical protein